MLGAVLLGALSVLLCCCVLCEDNHNFVFRVYYYGNTISAKNKKLFVKIPTVTQRNIV
jgi:hypothetical protein